TITAYNGTTKVATVEENWSATYLDLPGVSGNYASTPDSEAVSITGDIDIRVKVAMDDWTPASVQTLVAKIVPPDQESWRFQLLASGAISFVISTDGVNDAVSQASSAATGFSDGTEHWVRVTRAAAT